MKDLILAIDQGTTSTRAVIIDRDLHVLAKGQQEFSQHYPKPGWVEHDPHEIWGSTLIAITQALSNGQIDLARIAGIGITNQRETTVLWERAGGKALHNAIVWQDRRTTPICESLKKQGLEKKIRTKTGLVLDPYFSATKIQWLLDHNLPLRKLARNICFGTIDSFLTFKLTNGADHITDVSNASRTLLMNLAKIAWDNELLNIFRIPAEILPRISSSSEIYGTTKKVPGLPDGIPICGIAGDQQAALFGQACFNAGEAKCTYGTGSFLMMNTGKKIVRSRSGMLSTVAWKLGKQTTYALEGSAFIAGAAVQWLRDGLKIINASADVEQLATSVPDSGGVTFVPAFVGLGAPHWNPNARGVISGITRGTTAAHIARATLEGIAFLQYDILTAMQRDIGKRLKVLKVDGGAAADNLLMQFQSDILGTDLSRPQMLETTALGAGLLAGLALRIWKDLRDIARHWKENHRFTPKMQKKERDAHLARWQTAVHTSCG